MIIIIRTRIIIIIRIIFRSFQMKTFSNNMYILKQWKLINYQQEIFYRAWPKMRMYVLHDKTHGLETKSMCWLKPLLKPFDIYSERYAFSFSSFLKNICCTKKKIIKKIKRIIIMIITMLCKKIMFFF